MLSGKTNYFIGNDPAKWHKNIPTYARLKYDGVYPGVDLTYYGNQQKLEYDLVVAQGADPKPEPYESAFIRSSLGSGRECSLCSNILCIRCPSGFYYASNMGGDNDGPFAVDRQHSLGAD